MPSGCDEKGFTNGTLNALINVFESQFECENAVENLRQKLVISKQFNIHDAFVCCDYQNRGYFSISEVSLSFFLFK